MIVAAALVLGTFLGWAQPRHAIAGVLAVILALGVQLGLSGIADLAAATPPILPWETALISVVHASPLWATGAAAGLSAWLTSRFAHPSEPVWREGDPDRRSGTDRRKASRGPDRRASVREAYRL